MRNPPILAASVGVLIWPVQSLASTQSDVMASGDVPATALIGVAAAFALHHFTRRRSSLRWQRMNLGDHLPHLRLGERLHGLNLKSALLAALRLHEEPRAAALQHRAEHVRRVLIVDDDPDFRFTMGDALGAQGFAVIEAGDGYEGLRLAREERPDVILLDLSMPRLDGYGFRAAQRDDARIAAIPVVVVSGADADRAQGVEPAAFLHKPFDLRVLLDAVDRHAAVATAA